MNTNYKNSVLMIILLFVFVAPGVAAYFFYKNSNWFFSGRTNRGTLVHSPLVLPQLAAKRRWNLVFWSPVTCDQSCLNGLDNVARARLALGRRLYRVDSWLLLGPNAGIIPASIRTSLHEIDTHVLKLATDDRRYHNKLPKIAMTYIVDPNGFLVLSYPGDVKPNDIYHDLKQLLSSKE